MKEASRVSGPADIEDRRLRRLYEYWEKKRHGRRAPRRDDIDPTEIPDLLGYVNILEVRHEPRDFMVRLNGTEVTRMMGQEITGKWCSEVTPGVDGDRCKKAYDICVDEWSPAIVETSLAFCGKPYAGQTFVALPLSADGSRVDTMITAHSYHTLKSLVELFPFDEASEG
ncbi:MAG: PAS domain-containing protein [Rhodospirillales bacterium]|nr:MAG: PAS domain-containing protein [Rhodospirillales bacterium]